MKNILFVILDGLGDRPIKDLGGKTPLEAAKTPNLDWFSQNGLNGNVITVGKDIAPESDIAITAILGYDPYRFYKGRGPLEAYGAGMRIEKGDLCFRANFATIDEKGVIVDRRAGRNLTTKEARDLAEALNKKVMLPFGFTFKATSEHRGALVIRGEFSSHITNTDPAYEKKGTFGVVGKGGADKVATAVALDTKKVTNISADLENEFTRQSIEILGGHPVNIKRKKRGQLPANVVLLRDAGIELPTLDPKRGKWASVVGMPLEIALTKCAGLKTLIFEYPEIKGDDVKKNVEKNLDVEIKNTKSFYKKYYKNFKGFYIHIKQTDIPGHDGDYALKKNLIEKIDKDLIGFFREKEKDITLLVTGDHSTPCGLKNHSAHPVPLLIYNGGEKDGVKRFGESSSAKGSLGTVKGVQLMGIALSLSSEIGG